MYGNAIWPCNCWHKKKQIFLLARNRKTRVCYINKNLWITDFFFLFSLSFFFLCFFFHFFFEKLYTELLTWHYLSFSIQSLTSPRFFFLFSNDFFSLFSFTFCHQKNNKKKNFLHNLSLERQKRALKASKKITFWRKSVVSFDSFS